LVATRVTQGTEYGRTRGQATSARISVSAALSSAAVTPAMRRATRWARTNRST